MWPYLSKIEFMGVNVKAFIPPYSEQKKVYASPPGMTDSMKSMVQLKALHLENCKYSSRLDVQTLQLFSHNLLAIISNFRSLCCTVGRAPNKSKRFTDSQTF